MINVPTTMSSLSALSPFAPMTTLPPATQKLAEVQLDMLNDMVGKMVLAVEQVAHLQLHSVREAFEESSLAMRYCLEKRQPQDVLSVMTGRLEPASRKALLYGNKFMEIMTTTQAALVSVVENHFNEASRNVSKLVVDVSEVARKTGYVRAAESRRAMDVAISTSSGPATHAVVATHPGQQSPATT